MDALEAFGEVQHLSPGYKRVEQLLAEAERRNQPSFFQRLGHVTAGSGWGRWGLVAASILIVVAIFLTVGNGSGVAGNNDPRGQLKTLYEESQLAIENGNIEQAVVLLDQILDQDPDYANAADLRQDLIISLTPTSTPSPTPTPTPTPTEDPVIAMLDEAQKALELEQWPDVIGLLQEMRSIRPEFEEARISSLFCDAYIGRGLETLAGIRQQTGDEEAIISVALTDFEAGAAECPKRMDLQEQTKRASFYLEALSIPGNKPDTFVEILGPIVAAEPDYAAGNAKKLLYMAYLNRGEARREVAEVVGALSDYEAALALKVDDPSEAYTRRAELLLVFSQQPLQLTPESEPVETVKGSGDGGDTGYDEPTSKPVRIRFGKPKLIGPEDDVSFVGRLFEEAILEWESVGKLAADEYYDLTIMYIYADEPKYWGLATKDTRVQLIADDIGVGEAGGDRFYWWVTARKVNTALSPDSIDLPVSLRSEARTFKWVP